MKINFKKNWFVYFPLGFCSPQTVFLMKLKSIKWFTSPFVLELSALSQTLNLRRLTKGLMRKYWAFFELHCVGLQSPFPFMLFFPPRQSNTKWHVAVSNCCDWKKERKVFSPNLNFHTVWWRIIRKEEILMRVSLSLKKTEGKQFIKGIYQIPPRAS